jgi:hypothetical protein
MLRVKDSLRVPGGIILEPTIFKTNAKINYGNYISQALFGKAESKESTLLSEEYINPISNDDISFLDLQVFFY